MTVKIQPPPLPVVNPEALPASRPVVPPTELEPVGPKAYWGDRLTVLFWVLCFGLMLAMNFFEAVHRFVLFLIGRSTGS